MKYAFVEKHRLVVTVRAVCRCLRIPASDLYAWLKTLSVKERRKTSAKLI